MAQGNARSVDLSDRGVIADAMRAKLLASKQKMNKLVDNASVKVKQVIEEIQQKVDQLVDQLNVKAHQVNDKVFVKAEKFITKVEQIEDKYASYLSLGLDDPEIKAIEDVLPSAEPLNVDDVVPSVEDVVPSVETPAAQ